MVEHRLAKARVEGSNPFSRSKSLPNIFRNGLKPSTGSFRRGCALFVGFGEVERKAKPAEKSVLEASVRVA